MNKHHIRYSLLFKLIIDVYPGNCWKLIICMDCVTTTCIFIVLFFKVRNNLELYLLYIYCIFFLSFFCWLDYTLLSELYIKGIY